MSTDPVPVAFRAHDHAGCMRQAVLQARRICRRSGSRLTPLRAHVLELLWLSHKPLGAYDLLEMMTSRPLPGAGRPTPATVYRALDFLREHGLVHRIECRNAYIGCASPGRPHRSQFFICNDCGQTLELSIGPIGKEIESAAVEQGFSISDWNVEVAGHCPACQIVEP